MDFFNVAFRCHVLDQFSVVCEHVFLLKCPFIGYLTWNDFVVVIGEIVNLRGERDSDAYSI